MEAAPEATEHGYPGWHGIAYRHPVAGYICGIFPQKDHVRLLFEHGQQLPDPAGMLTAGGTQTKWMSLSEIDAIVEAPIAELVESAVAFGAMNRKRRPEPRGAKRDA